MPNIVVLVKRVPDTNARIVVNGDRVDLSAVKWVISPYDEFAIETALQHKEADGGSVTALTLGPAGADKILKDAKAIGVDEIAIHLGHKYLTLVYQIDKHCTRLLWAGKDRTAKTLLRFFRMLFISSLVSSDISIYILFR